MYEMIILYVFIGGSAVICLTRYILFNCAINNNILTDIYFDLESQTSYEWNMFKLNNEINIWLKLISYLFLH